MLCFCFDGASNALGHGIGAILCYSSKIYKLRALVRIAHVAINLCMTVDAGGPVEKKLRK